MIQRLRKGLLLIIKVREDKQISFHVVIELHSSNPWASDWLKRYDKECLEGLKDRKKVGRPPDLSEETIYQIKQELKESKKSWITKKIEELIIKKNDIKYHYTHIYHILRKWGFKQKVPRKIRINTVSPEEKEAFKKKTEQVFVDMQQQQQDRFIIVSTDESFFFYEYCKTRLDL